MSIKQLTTPPATSDGATPCVRRWRICVGPQDVTFDGAPADTHCWVHFALRGEGDDTIFSAHCALVSLSDRFDKLSTPDQTKWACENVKTAPEWFSTLLAVVSEWGDHNWRRPDGQPEPIPDALLGPLTALVDGKCTVQQFHDRLFAQE